LQLALHQVNELKHRVQQHSQQQLAKAKQQLSAYWLSCTHSVQLSLKAQQQQLSHWQTQLRWSGQHHCQRHQQQLQQWQQTLLPAAERLLAQENRQLVHYHQLVRSMHPKRLLAQGYVLARNEAGQVITSAEQVASLLQLKLTFSDGSISVTPQPNTLTLTEAH
jgi:exonuclease VII large subunit